MRKLFFALSGLGLIGLVAGPALAGGIPADRVVAVATDSVIVDSNTGNNTAESVILFGDEDPDAADAILYKMSTSGDIIVSLHMECKIVTNTVVKGSRAGGGAVTQDSSRGFARVFIELQALNDLDSKVVLNIGDFTETGDPLCGDSIAGATCIAINQGAVTMCDRIQDLKLTSDGDEVLELNLATLQTHGFTWFGEDVAREIGDNEVNIIVRGQVFGENGGLINVRKRVLEIDTAHFAK